MNSIEWEVISVRGRTVLKYNVTRYLWECSDYLTGQTPYLSFMSVSNFLINLWYLNICLFANKGNLKSFGSYLHRCNEVLFLVKPMLSIIHFHFAVYCNMIKSLITHIFSLIYATNNLQNITLKYYIISSSSTSSYCINLKKFCYDLENPIPRTKLERKKGRTKLLARVD